MRIKYVGINEFQAYVRDPGKYYIFNPAQPDTLVQEVTDGEAKELMEKAHFEIVDETKQAEAVTGNEVPGTSAAKKKVRAKKL